MGTVMGAMGAADTGDKRDTCSKVAKGYAWIVCMSVFTAVKAWQIFPVTREQIECKRDLYVSLI